MGVSVCDEIQSILLFVEFVCFALSIVYHDDVSRKSVAET